MKLARGGNEEGFVLVAALLTLLILMAIATLIYTVTTKDARISIRRVGEQKAFAAAEAGIHALIASLNANAGNATSSAATNVVVDSGDPNSVYTIMTAAPPSGVPAARPLAGYEIGGSNNKNWGQSITNMAVEGKNTQYNTTVTVDVGVGFGPIEISTGQPAAGG